MMTFISKQKQNVHTKRIVESVVAYLGIRKWRKKERYTEGAQESTTVLIVRTTNRKLLTAMMNVYYKHR